MAKVKSEVKKSVETKKRLTEIEKLVVRAGKIKEKYDELSKMLKETKDKLAEIMENGQEIQVGNYKVKKIEKIRADILPELVAKKLKKSELVEVVSVSKTKLSKYMSDKEIMECEGDKKVINEIKISYK